MNITASALWLNTVFAGFDQSITLAVHQLYDLGGGFFTPFFEFISFLGKGGLPLIFISLLLALYKPTRRFGTAMCLSLAVGALITKLSVRAHDGGLRLDDGGVPRRRQAVELDGVHLRVHDGHRTHIPVRALPFRRAGRNDSGRYRRHYGHRDRNEIPARMV